MIYHILNGDSLAGTFPGAKIEGEIIVMRECLIEGNVQGKTLDDFISTRAKFIADTYREDEKKYYEKVGGELEKLVAAPDHSEFNLWFEYDLFCQANMWFLLSLLHDLPISKKVYAVYTTYLKENDGNFWSGFGPANADDIRFSFAGRIAFTDKDLQFGKELWLAYQQNDLERLQSLSQNESACFPYLKEVVQAHSERFPSTGKKGRPEKVLEEIIAGGARDFRSVFIKFRERESIYGFGDIQVKHLYDKLMEEQ